MSLRDDFELCLEYAEALELKQAQQVQAQNNFIFVKNESERLKNKLRICTILSVVSGIILALAIMFVSYLTISFGTFEAAVLPYLIFPGGVLIIALFNLFKTKSESSDYETQKNRLIQQHSATAENCEYEIAELIKEIEQKNLLDIVPANYFGSAAIEFCLNQIDKKLATTPYEAFRLLDSEIKRLEEMEHLEQLNNARIEQLNSIKRAIDINTLVILSDQNRRYN